MIARVHVAWWYAHAVHASAWWARWAKDVGLLTPRQAREAVENVAFALLPYAISVRTAA